MKLSLFKAASIVVPNSNRIKTPPTRVSQVIHNNVSLNHCHLGNFSGLVNGLTCTNTIQIKIIRIENGYVNRANMQINAEFIQAYNVLTSSQISGKF